MSRYVSYEAFSEQEFIGLSTLLSALAHQFDTDEVLGVYYTHDLSLLSRVWFFSEGIVYEINQSYFQNSYSNMAKVEVKHEEKKNIKGLVVLTTDVKEYFIPIQGNKNGTSDAFEILRYFIRVIDDSNSYQHE